MRMNEKTIPKWLKPLTDDEVSEIVNKKAIPPKERDDRLFELCENCKSKCGQQKEFIKYITSDNMFLAREAMFGEGNERCSEYKNSFHASDKWNDACFALPSVLNVSCVDIIDTENIYHRAVNTKHLVEGKTKVNADYLAPYGRNEYYIKYWKYVPEITRIDVDRLY